MLDRSRSRDRSKTGGAFSPAGLFVTGAQGAWYDPSDYSTLFQNAAGTTPVTAVEQPVRLMLDRSGRGNNATAPNDASRPVLRARYNLLTFSEQFDNAGWVKTVTTATANAAVAPDGTTTADTVTANSSGIYRVVRRQSAGLAINVTYTLSVYAKKDTSDWFYLKFWDAGANGVNAWFNLATGALGTVEAGCTASIVAAANGFYRCSITRTIGGSIAFNELDLGLSNADNTVSATAGNSVFLWGAQLLTAADAAATGNAYQRIAAATDYDTSNPVWRPYLAFDGSDDSFSTSAIDFSGTDEMTVFAGVTKLSDANPGIVVEFGTQSASSNGFGLIAPDGFAVARYGVECYGTARNSRRYETYAAPVTNVITAALTTTAANSAAAMQIRINAAAVSGTLNVENASTGNFSNKSLFIGRRDNTSVPFNGRLTSLIVLGRTATAAEISATEAWVAGKTGVTL